jgi:hypothetical protein
MSPKDVIDPDEHDPLWMGSWIFDPEIAAEPLYGFRPYGGLSVDFHGVEITIGEEADGSPAVIIRRAGYGDAFVVTPNDDRWLLQTNITDDDE